MSTKIYGLSWIAAECGVLISMRVSHVERWVSLFPVQIRMLLRRTSEMCIFIRIREWIMMDGRVYLPETCMNLVTPHIILLLLSVGIWEISNHADPHNVDEDLTTIPSHGCHRNMDSWAGVICRDAQNIPTDFGGYAASSNMKNWLNIIQIGMMSTKSWWLSRFKVECGTRTTR